MGGTQAQEVALMQGCSGGRENDGKLCSLNQMNGMCV